MGKTINFFRSTKGKILLVMLPAVAIPLILLLIPRKPIGVWGAVAAIVSALVPLICIIIAYFILKRSLTKAGTAVGRFVATKDERRPLDAVVFRQMVGCSRLGVLSTIYTDVVMLKKSRAGGLFKSHGIYKYVGKIEGGIQHLEDCRFEVDHPNDTIRVQLPQAAITGHEIIKLEKFDEKSSSFCKIENSEVMDEVQQRKANAEQLLVEYGFMREVEKRAQEVISGMIAAMGYSGYDILFSGEKEPVKLVEVTPSEERQAPHPASPQMEDQPEDIIAP